MSRNTCALVAAAAMAIGLTASACGTPAESATKAPAPASATQLQSLVPTPASAQRMDGPDSIPGNGIEMYLLLNGASTDVLDAYKAALEGQG